MNSLLSTSPIESLPLEILNHVFGWLKKSPWKLPLGRCSKVLYSAFVFHIERRKGHILKSYRCMRYAAMWGDPILTQIPLNVENFGRHAFIDLCISGNLELVRYVDTYLLRDDALTKNEQSKLHQRFGRWHSCAIKTLLRFNTFNRDIAIAIPLETIDKFIYYFFEDLSQTVKDRYIHTLSGVIEVHGKDTCLFPMFEDFMLRHNNYEYVLRKIRILIIKEYFYVGDIEKAQTIEYPWTFYIYWPYYRKLHVGCVEAALFSPNQNKEVLITAWNNYVGYVGRYVSRFGRKYHRNSEDMHTFWTFAIANNKTEMFYHLAQKYITEHNIRVDYYDIWIRNLRANQTHIELWNLDPRMCLIRILRLHDNFWRGPDNRRKSLNRLIKYYPDILHQLSVEEQKLYQYLGLFCPKCLKCVVKQSNNINEDHQCRYCKHVFPSIFDKAKEVTLK